MLAVVSVGTFSNKNVVEAANTIYENNDNGGVSNSVSMSISRSFQITYYKDQYIGKEVDINDNVTNPGSQTTPDLTNGELKVEYKKDGARTTKTVKMSEAYENADLQNKTYDYLEISGFTTQQTFGSNEKKVVRTMVLKLHVMDTDDGEKVAQLEVKYVVYAGENEYKSAIDLSATINKVTSVLNNILTPIIIVVCSIGVVYSLFLGFKMAKANNAEEREEAKKRIIYTIVAIAIGVLMIIMFQVFAASASEWFGLSVDGVPEFFKL